MQSCSLTQSRAHLPAHVVADDIRVTDNQRVGVLLLVGFGAVEVLSEARLYSGPILEELLQAQRSGGANQWSRNSRGAATYVRLWVPVADGRLGGNRCALLDQRAVVDRHVRDFRRNNLARLLRPGHRRSNHLVERNLEVSEPLAGEGRLLASDFSQIPVRVLRPVQVVLTVTHQNQMPDRFRFDRFQFLVEFVLPLRRRVRLQRPHQTLRVAARARSSLV